MTRYALLVGSAMLAATLAGCEIYFGPGDGSDGDCSQWGTCDDDQTWPDQPPPGTPGGACNASYECAAGCICDQGACVETGFCQVDWDCAIGFECDEARATCTPEGSQPQGCMIDTDCPMGNFCDLATATCVPSWGCTTNQECGPGWECANNTCVPVPCDADVDCFEGCACQVSSGVCQETGFCSADQDCPAFCDANGVCSEMVCDEGRQTCTWPESQPNPPQCGGPLTCEVGAPVCPAGETPAILEGCYTGECIQVAQCPDTPLALCENIENPNQCINRLDCDVNWNGVNCTCNGQPCNCDENPGLCTCESYEYSCESI